MANKIRKKQNYNNTLLADAQNNYNMFFEKFKLVFVLYVIAMGVFLSLPLFGFSAKVSASDLGITSESGKITINSSIFLLTFFIAPFVNFNGWLHFIADNLSSGGQGSIMHDIAYKLLSQNLSSSMASMLSYCMWAIYCISIILCLLWVVLIVSGILQIKKKKSILPILAISVVTVVVAIVEFVILLILALNSSSSQGFALSIGSYCLLGGSIGIMIINIIYAKKQKNYIQQIDNYSKELK